jgi:hypothetical protein
VRNWTLRRALELAAVAAPPERAATAREALEKSDRDLDETLAPPSRIEQAESLQRRIRVLRAAGRAAEADSLQPRLREALQGQHPASPRHAWATAG